MTKQDKKKHYIYVEVPLSVKNAAKRKAMRAGVSLRQWVTETLKEAK